MKKIIALFLLLALCLPLLFGCAASLSSESEKGENEEKEEVQKTEEAEETGEIVYPKGYSVGYASVDISGDPATGHMVYYGGTAEGVHDPLMLTCIALCDGENVALIMTADLKKMYGENWVGASNVAGRSLELVEKNFGIPADSVIISCTHSHSAPDAGEDVAGNVRWQQQYYKQLTKVVDKALRDLDEVEGAYTGKANVAEGSTFVRRYHLADGTFTSPGAAANAVAHESDADPELRTIRFDRKNKKDVLLVNFQTHYGGADHRYPSQFSADFVDPFRDQAADEFDSLVAYYSGAGANIGFSTAIEGERKFNSYEEVVKSSFIPATKEAVNKEEKIDMGKVIGNRSIYTGTCMQRSPERVEQVREAGRAGGASSAEGASLMKKYGIESDLEIQHTLRHASLPETLPVPFTAISFGDVAFCTTPYEMFDTNGKQVRDASPFQNTFVCTLAGGALGYVPSALGFENGSYETFNCAFRPGSGEEFANELIRMLNENYSKK